MSSIELNEIIDFFESNYTPGQQEDILKILARTNHTIENSPLLHDLIKKGILQISKEKHIEYRLRKYFEKNNIEKISERKEFIFSKVPNLKGLKNGKSASYYNLIEFVTKNYSDIFDEILADFKVYDFTEKYSEMGHKYAYYLYRKLTPKSNYWYNTETEKHELKDDEMISLLRERKVNFEVDKPEELFTVVVDLDEAFDNCITKTLATEMAQNFLKNSKCLLIIGIIFLIICFPIGILICVYYFTKKKRAQAILDGTYNFNKTEKKKIKINIWKTVFLILFWPYGIYYLIKNKKVDLKRFLPQSENKR